MTSELYRDVLRDAVNRLVQLLHAAGQIVRFEIDRDATARTGHLFVSCKPTDCFRNLVAAIGAIEVDINVIKHGSSSKAEPGAIEL